MPWIPPTNGKSFKEQLDAAYAKAESRRKARDGKQYSSAWYSGELTDLQFDQYQNKYYSPEYLMKLASVRRSMIDFANIVLGRSVPVSFSAGNQSYSSIEPGKEHLVISATNDPNKIDVMCGLMLHEASHIKWTNYTPQEPDSAPIHGLLARFLAKPYEFLPKEVITFGNKLGLTQTEYTKDFKFLLNVIEDRRIDRLMYEFAVGYRPYYEALYDEYWHTPQISKGLLSPLSHQPLVSNYRFHICNMTNDLANPAFLPSLQEIHDLINLKEIRRFGADPRWHTYHTKTIPDPIHSTRYPLEHLPEMAQVVFKIMGIMYENSVAQGAALPNETEGKAKWKKGMKFRPGDPNNLDYDDSQEISLDKNDYTEEEFAELMKDLEDMVNGAYKRDLLNNNAAAELNNLEDAKAEFQEVGDDIIGKAKCLIYKRLTPSLLMKSGPFTGGRTFNSNTIDSPITQGLRLGSILASKLTVLAEETTLKHSRLSSGKIDKRLIHSLGFGAEQVFEQSQVIKMDPVFIHLSIDNSGSMAGVKWFQAMKLAAAMAKVAEKISTIDLVISLRTSSYDLVTVLVAYDSRTDPISKVIKLFPKLGATGGTPEGLAFDSLKGLIAEDDHSRQRYFINISDGQPSFASNYDGMKMNYSDTPAYEHTRRRVQAMRQAGIQVMSYYVCERDNNVYDSKAFRKMYGKDAQFINVQSVSDIARTMNQLLLRGAIDK